MYHRELEVAALAVQRASVLTKQLSDHVAALSSGTQIKTDKLPVTIGDYAAQALINNALSRNFPNDKIVGEEDSALLKEEPGLGERVLEILQQVQAQTKALLDILGELGALESVYASIDLGNYAGKTGRFWALDPIDGTKGFLRGDQFAVCLALIEDGEVKLGVIGCPNLHADVRGSLGPKGGLFMAVKGAGAYYQPLFADIVPLNQQTRINMGVSTDPAALFVVEGVEKGHLLHLTQAQIKQLLGLPETGRTLHLDSQVKYCVLASGQADIYLRLPTSATYREKIWDHAAGNVLVHEAGGKVGDVRGTPLDFGKGRHLESSGVIAANAAVFDSVISCVQQALNQ